MKWFNLGLGLIAGFMEYLSIFNKENLIAVSFGLIALTNLVIFLDIGEKQ